MNLLRTDFGVSIVIPGAEPLPIRHIMGIGMNYAEHAKEQGKGTPERPVVFSKNPAAASLGGEAIIVPKVCQERPQVDYEAELGVVVGWRGAAEGAAMSRDAFARDVPLPQALSYVLGYCCANDVSARWWQKEGSGGQFCRGKGFDTFCPLGPELVAARNVPDPQSLKIRAKVNGETRQYASTADMIFPVAMLISELSRGTTLLPGTLILTGTPSGVGMARTPPTFLQDGDSVEIEIEKVGTITNKVRFE